MRIVCLPRAQFTLSLRLLSWGTHDQNPRRRQTAVGERGRRFLRLGFRFVWFAGNFDRVGCLILRNTPCFVRWDVSKLSLAERSSHPAPQFSTVAGERLLGIVQFCARADSYIKPEVD